MRSKLLNLPVLSASPLPPLYAGWIDGFLAGPIPPETDATCDSCAMLPEAGQETNDKYFNAETKCCTYLPSLYNFLVGRALLDSDPTMAKGRATVESRVGSGLGISPLGLMPTPAYLLLYDQTTNAFGHAKALRCPHYLTEAGGRCGVWKNRESTCVTWFCKTTRGLTGKAFWRALHELLMWVEKSLAVWCVTQLTVDTDTLFAVLNVNRKVNPTARELDNQPDTERQRRIWGRWHGRETEFYQECGRLVSDLRWPDIERICGPELAIHTRLTRQAYQKLVAEDVPARLQAAMFQISVEKNSYVVNVSGYDAMRVSPSVLKVLPYFDGRPTGEIVEDIIAQENLRALPSLLRKLTDFGLLVEVEEANNRPATG